MAKVNIMGDTFSIEVLVEREHVAIGNYNGD